MLAAVRLVMLLIMFMLIVIDNLCEYVIAFVNLVKLYVNETA